MSHDASRSNKIVGLYRDGKLADRETGVAAELAPQNPEERAAFITGDDRRGYAVHPK